MYDLGTFLKNERLNKKKSVKDTAENLKVSSSYISMVENNKTFPNSDYLYNLASYLYGGEKIFDMLVAEKYIMYCLVGGIKVQPYPFVKFLLTERGMFENNSMVAKPYYSLNWLLNQHNSPITFGFKNDNHFSFDLEEIEPISDFDFFNGEPKAFIQLDLKDKKFIYELIESYLKTKYSNLIENRLNPIDNDVDLIIEKLFENTDNSNIATPIFTIDELTKSDNQNNVVHIRKNWKVINQTELDFLITKESLLGIKQQSNTSKKYIKIGEIEFDETKNNLTNFLIKFPNNYQIDIKKENKEIIFDYKK
ncbi:helix-turn-helix transcriptional regulator [Staphylococcus pasteuri]|uniref:helix-turn-helix domain-containing protein n=1 Tax=Staphylococcus pasteuri TaxID=45972 RepID=UPI001C278A5A|nr:helix-turn-helix transcriptional regulator [Staphylococcus pasteuri]MCO0861704.1 helix-turn-helix domain-containing protein [Staphylococcus pasteuri]MCO5359855.1 helix-turn-helix domain-containing protein [Staphylococcus pasteuri]